jgi:hypothetical protein
MEKYWNTICYLSKLFDDNGIEYQFDASTAVFIHGIEFEMDDLDMCILMAYREKVLELLSTFKRTDMEVYENRMEYCYVQIEDIKVHLMFPYYKVDCQEETRDIIYKGVSIHTKTMEFYRRHKGDAHPLAERIDQKIAEMKNRGII